MSRQSKRNICTSKFKSAPLDLEPRKSNKLEETIIVIVCSIIFTSILIILLFWAVLIRRRWEESKIEAFAHKHNLGARHLLFGGIVDEYEITPKELKIEADIVLGSGVAGKVYKGHMKKKRNNELIEMDVAVKFSHVYANEKVRQEMIEEIGLMKKIGQHKNLLTMIGYVKSIENPVILSELCSNGDLSKLLRKHKIHFMDAKKCEEVEICLLLDDLLRISLEVYLTSLGYIHRDIAARNVLLTNDLTAKLGDFGLCCLANNFSNVKEGEKLPIKNMPYEALKYGKFSEKSDVWSFGVLLYEIFSGGKTPFHNIEAKEFTSYLELGGKPEFPIESPEKLVQILNDMCFQRDPNERATFVELEEKIRNIFALYIYLEQGRKSNF